MRSRQRGTVLIAVMFAVAVLGLAAMSLAYEAALLSRAVRQREVVLRLRSQARSAAAVALARIGQDRSGFDHPAEAWGSPPPLHEEPWLEAWSDAPAGAILPEYEVHCEVVDEEGKLHVARASSAALEELGLTAEQSAALLDWVDADDAALPGGAESETYARRPVPHRAKNAPLQMLEELLLIEGFTAADFAGPSWTGADAPDADAVTGDAEAAPEVARLLTTFGDGRINLNTAPEPVLRALPISHEAARQIAAFTAFDRDSGGDVEEHVFQSAEDLAQLQGLTDADLAVLEPLARFTSSRFRLFIRVTHRPSGVTHRLHVLARRGEDTVEVIYFRPGAFE